MVEVQDFRHLGAGHIETSLAKSRGRVAQTTCPLNYGMVIEFRRKCLGSFWSISLREEKAKNPVTHEENSPFITTPPPGRIGLLFLLCSKSWSMILEKQMKAGMFSKVLNVA